MRSEVRRLLLIAVAYFGAASLVVGVAKATDDEQALTQRPGELSVAVYKNYAPFSWRNDKGRLVGIDVDIAKALAEELGLRLSLREQVADESVEDDLRNAVWKGHYLGGGTADVMLHVPVDPVFAARNDQVAFVAPYFREQVLMAFREDVGAIDGSPSSLIGARIGVEIDTLADTFVLSALNGVLREQVSHYPSLRAAGQALENGEIDAVIGNGSEVQAFCGAQEGVRLSRVALPGLQQTQWDLGAAVKSDAAEPLGGKLNLAM
ncbi:MAG: transporter substrate-binding domain-containing protein, partial [Pseudomonadota bacterium]